jgi:hypothetical protein
VRAKGLLSTLAIRTSMPLLLREGVNHCFEDSVSFPHFPSSKVQPAKRNCRIRTNQRLLDHK